MIRIYAALIAAAVMLGAAGWAGHKITAASYQADIIKQQQATEAAVEAERKRADEAAQQLEEARGKREVQYQTITKTVDRIVERPVYRNDCIDDDGLRAANAGLTGAPDDTGKPDAAMPAADAATGQDGR